MKQLESSAIHPRSKALDSALDRRLILIKRVHGQVELSSFRLIEKGLGVPSGTKGPVDHNLRGRSLPDSGFPLGEDSVDQFVL
jgi:hypothetical protein